MNKKIIALAVGVALAGSASVASANPCAAKDTAGVSGFIDVIYTVADESRDNTAYGPSTVNASAMDANDTDRTFDVAAEIDFVSTMGGADVRVDLDVSGSSTHVEQAYLAWGINDALTLVAGVFNNPMTADHHDAPDMSFTTHSATYNVIASQNASDVAGVAIAGAVGPVTVTLGLLSDLSGTTAEENSIALIVNASPMENLDVELGYVTQDDVNNGTATATTAGNVLDINAAYSMDAFTVGFDYLTADNIVDNAYTLDAGFAATDELNLGLRLDNVAFEATGADDVSATTVYASYAAADNLAIALEIKSGDNAAATSGDPTGAVSGINDGNLAQIELIATF